jgi:predicted DNA-binding transcriptional regulator AlpA
MVRSVTLGGRIHDARRAVAKRFGVTERTLLNWEADNKFPAPVRIGQTSFYDRKGVEEFILRSVQREEAVQMASKGE